MISPGEQVKTNRPKRHQTLTFGVSEDDLERARSVMRSSSRADDLSRNQDNKRSSSRHSLPDVFDGSSHDFGRLGMTEPPRPLVSSSSSVHVSFLSPVESEAQLPSFSSSSKETFPLPNHSTS